MTFISAGEILITPKETSLNTVCTFGIVLCFYHSKEKISAICHFLYVENNEGKSCSSTFGKVCLAYLFKEFKERELKLEDFEIHLYGGAVPEGAGEEYRKVVAENLEWVEGVLQKYQIQPTHVDVKGNRGRKIIFNTGTGECIVAKVNHVRTEDWVINYHSPVYRSSNERDL